MRWRNASVVAVGAMVGLMSSAASADPIADFYKGKQINWILSAGAGGGYASYAHVFAPYFSSHIPGNPSIIIQNMPGAGGIRAMIYLQQRRAQGRHHHRPCSFERAVRAALWDQGANVRSPPDELDRQHQCRDRHLRVLDCIRRHHLAGFVRQGIHRRRYRRRLADGDLPAMLNKLFGTKIKIISGYKGGNDVYLAMERGEVQGRCGGLKSSISRRGRTGFRKRRSRFRSRSRLSAIRIPGFARGDRVRQGRNDQADSPTHPGARWLWIARSWRRPARHRP